MTERELLIDCYMDAALALPYEAGSEEIDELAKVMYENRLDEIEDPEDEVDHR